MEATSCLETIDNQKKKMAKLSFSTEFCKFDCAVSVTQGSHTRISPCLPACQVDHCHYQHTGPNLNAYQCDENHP